MEKAYIIAFAAFFCQPAVGGVAMTLSNATGLPLRTPILFCSVYVPLAIYLITVQGGRALLRSWFFAVSYVGLVILVLTSLAIHPEYESVMFNSDWYGNLMLTLFNPLAPVFALFIVSVAPSPRGVRNGLIVSAFITFVADLVRFVWAQSRGYWNATDSLGNTYESAYNLGFGYSVLFSVVVFMYLAFSKERVLLHSALATVGVVMILLGGSRGALGFVVLAMVIFLVYFWSQLTSAVRGAVLGLLASGSLAVMAFGGPAQFLVKVVRGLESHGITSRSLTSLLDGSFSDPNGRDRLKEISAELISEGGFFGHGFFGDRYHIRPSFRWGYPHNILDELQISFGWTLGLLALLLIVAFVAQAVLQRRYTAYAGLVVLVLPLVFQLTISSSYLLSDWFWALMGLSFLAVSSGTRGKKERRKSLLGPRSDIGTPTGDSVSGQAEPVHRHGRFVLNDHFSPRRERLLRKSSVL